MTPKRNREDATTLIQVGSGSFPKDERLLKGHEFRYMRENGESFVGKYVVMSYAKAEDGKRKVGIVVSKRFNKRAVVRNRAKRIIRESYRMIKTLHEGYWFVFIARHRLQKVDAIELQQEIIRLMQQAKVITDDQVSQLNLR